MMADIGVYGVNRILGMSEFVNGRGRCDNESILCLELMK